MIYIDLLFAKDNRNVVTILDAMATCSVRSKEECLYSLVSFAQVAPGGGTTFLGILQEFPRESVGKFSGIFGPPLNFSFYPKISRTGLRNKFNMLQNRHHSKMFEILFCYALKCKIMVV